MWTRKSHSLLSGTYWAPDGLTLEVELTVWTRKSHSLLSGTYWAPDGLTRESELTVWTRKSHSFSSLHAVTVTPPDETNLLDISSQLFDSRGVAGGVTDGWAQFFDSRGVAAHVGDGWAQFFDSRGVAAGVGDGWAQLFDSQGVAGGVGDGWAQSFDSPFFSPPELGRRPRGVGRPAPALVRSRSAPHFHRHVPVVPLRGSRHFHRELKRYDHGGQRPAQRISPHQMVGFPKRVRLIGSLTRGRARVSSWWVGVVSIGGHWGLGPPGLAPRWLA